MNGSNEAAPAAGDHARALEAGAEIALRRWKNRRVGITAHAASALEWQRVAHGVPVAPSPLEALAALAMSVGGSESTVDNLLAKIALDLRMVLTVLDPVAGTGPNAFDLFALLEGIERMVKVAIEADESPALS